MYGRRESCVVPPIDREAIPLHGVPRCLQERQARWSSSLGYASNVKQYMIGRHPCSRCVASL